MTNQFTLVKLIYTSFLTQQNKITNKGKINLTQQVPVLPPQSLSDQPLQYFPLFAMDFFLCWLNSAIFIIWIAFHVYPLLYYSDKISFTKILDHLTNSNSFTKKFYNWPVRVKFWLYAYKRQCDWIGCSIDLTALARGLWLACNSALYCLCFSPLASENTTGSQATSLNTRNIHQ